MTSVPLPQEQKLLDQAVSLHQRGEVGRAYGLYQQVLETRPNDAALLRLIGACEIQLGDMAQAAGHLTRSLAITPNQPGVLYNLGLALQDLGQLDEAVAAYDAAIALKPDYADAHNNRGNALLAIGRYIEALAGYDRALALRPETAETYGNRAIALNALGRQEAAAACYRKALVLNPHFANAYVSLADIYERQGDAKRAVVQWSRMAEAFASDETARAYHLKALHEMTRLLMDVLRDDAGAETVARQSLRLRPSLEDAAQDFINVRQRQCAWPVVEPFEGVARQDILRGMSPLAACAYTDDPVWQLAVNARRNPLSTEEATILKPADAQAGPLRIGYLSSDLNTHPIGRLMFEVPTLHDRAKVQTFAYYSGPQVDDAHHHHYRAAFDNFIDIAGMDDAAAAQRIADDGVQVLVDINGHTHDNRKGVLARRPAPVIVNWLGFPGSMGSPHHHYIIADEWIIPPSHEVFYSEAVLRLDCYQPNNRHRLVSGATPTRARAGLPQDAFVFCCFNDTKKITRHTFNRWLKILQRTPDSVLWLLSAAEATQRNLRAYAALSGVEPSRIIFAEWRANPEHLARYRLADLFLDTAPYGAHTTCSDALWMGVPVLTLSGRSFASRVCGSLLRQAGLPELVTVSADAYVEEAVALAHDRDRLASYGARLRAGRDTSVLFDTPALVRRLEALYEEMWQACLAGRLPTPDLRNMARYFAVGAGHDHEAIEVLSLGDYQGWWHDRMAASPVQFGPDARLSDSKD